ncbi:tripartite motif-containing protein 2 [Aplysia californica]|uniref:Tripartite motif-containing protein 2 n=1 Tax=Aplysia californica TaxID=6500 RepID=A0ABM0JWL1_APLCA|nr:tripartite motif-containing protein 2 [Aplysia californica]
MSVVSLRTQIREDHLTCSICCEEFKNPKALPCLHTFCANCLRDYVVGRGYESVGSFPCPVCRANTQLPATGVDGFPNNHLMSSLSHTMDSANGRPVPKPRRSLGQNPPPQSTTMNQEIRHNTNTNINVDAPAMNYRPEDNMSLPPPYSSVADTNPAADSVNVVDTSSWDAPQKSKVCSNDNDPSWMVVPREQPATVVDPVSPGDFCVVSVTQPSNMSTGGGGGSASFAPQPPGFGWNLGALDQVPMNSGVPTPTQRGPEFNTARTVNTHDPAMAVNPQSWPSRPNPPVPAQSAPPLYPTVPQGSEFSSTACTENLMLRFGKQGSSVRDFFKPVGLTVSKEGCYIISDNGGEQSRIFIYNSGGELTAAFKTGYRVKDVTMTKKNEIFAAVQSNTAAFRHFTLGGQLKGEYGKFFTYEAPCGIAVLSSGGAVVTGTQNHSVYVLTDQMKLATKFGRKGNGDGYFLSPAHVAVDSKNHIIVTDKQNNSVQVFNAEGKFKLRFNATRSGQLQAPLGVCTDNKDNIIVADSGNGKVEAFSSHGRWLSTVVRNTHELGEKVKPVNVAVTPTGKVAVLLRGPYFAEVRVYTSHHQQISQEEGPSPCLKIRRSCR